MKKILGLILELNPLHNGHKYFIKKAIEDTNPDLVVACISTNFTMRGEISIIDKFTKVKLLLDMGIDLVLELPFMGAVCSADYFAYNSCKILSDVNVTDIAFGVEIDDFNKLYTLNTLTQSEEFTKHLKSYLDKGNSYSSSCNKALFELTDDKTLIENYSLPNNTLALQYLKSINSINPKINVHPIKRINNNYYDELVTGDISSATSIRELLKKETSVSDYVPYTYDFININDSYKNLFNLLKYQDILSDLDYFGAKEGINMRISKILNSVNTYDDLIKNSQTKRYTSNYIKRLILHIVMNTEKDESSKITYLRVLGFSSKGKKHIKSLSKDIKNSIVTSFKNTNNKECLRELKATRIYELITNKTDLVKQEFLIPFKKSEDINE